MKKYCFTDETRETDGHILHRIIALVDIPSHGINKGDFGGWIEKEENLSHEGTCWVSRNAQVFGDASVCDNAHILGNAQVFGNARILHCAKAYENAQVFSNARVFGDAVITGNARICDNACIFGNSIIMGNVVIKELIIHGFAMIE